MEFVFVSGDPALDLVGTVQRRRSLALDQLATPADLAAWAVAAGLVDQPMAADAEDLAQAVRLREAVYRLATAAARSTPYGAADRRLLNRLADGPHMRQELRPDGTLRRTGTAEALLAALARSAQRLLALPLAAPVKECAAEPCTRLYVDHSRKGARRWCDMTRCGNRAKAASFRERHLA
ncbi:CGNR zinc finger domain-containing protein [Kitasatospora sp. NPDC096147]|uniref:CGNR zinc finger domain-containing protein n=1 Tax=Kitasatospora sp. NPDC096147 TaxID=3364093 RepID=UPI00380A4A31